jgi:hypothetical protein
MALAAAMFKEHFIMTLVHKVKILEIETITIAITSNLASV